MKDKYLENAVDALLAGKDVAVKETKAIGCGIKLEAFVKRSSESRVIAIATEPSDASDKVARPVGNCWTRWDVTCGRQMHHCIRA